MWGRFFFAGFLSENFGGLDAIIRRSIYIPSTPLFTIIDRDRNANFPFVKYYFYMLYKKQSSRFDAPIYMAIAVSSNHSYSLIFPLLSLTTPLFDKTASLCY